MSFYPEHHLTLLSRETDSPEAVELFFALWHREPTPEESEFLQQLLRAKPRAEADIAGSGCFATARYRTTSPWSSKATNIAHRCELAALVRVEQGWWYPNKTVAEAGALHDEMREGVISCRRYEDWRGLFAIQRWGEVGRKYTPIECLTESPADREYLSRRGVTSEDFDYLAKMYADLSREDYTLAEVIMFAQANSEHCRHKIFNARWQERGDESSLMAHIRRTHAASPEGVVTAFNDNSAVIYANAGADFSAGNDGLYREVKPDGGLYIVAKAETHNHPTAVSPYPGAATGSGGEIRDEAAAGRGAVARAGFSGYMISTIDGKVNMPPAHIASARQIITEGPIGAAAYNNEFGRTALAGFFRAYQEKHSGRIFGFHKPVMLAGGVGHMLPHAAGKRNLSPGDLIVHLGGEGFRIGIGGGAASSGGGGADEGLDFASVQRDNAEMQRRAQQVIDTFRTREDNPILSLHDVGAGGLSNAVTELVHSAGRGANIDMEKIPVKEGMSAEDVWCNESQERYVLAIAPQDEQRFMAVCARECCPCAIIGTVTEKRDIYVSHSGQEHVNLPLKKILSVPNNLHIVVQPLPAPAQDPALNLAEDWDFSTAACAVLRHPTVACKRFLITIGDRTVGGLTAREQMVGPWQTPVADCAAICHDFQGVAGAVFALGERAAAAARRPDAAVRLAISESLLNLAAADVEMKQVKMSLNWMANCEGVERQSELYAAVKAASEFCIAMGIGVIVGKDSLSMRMPTRENSEVMVESPAFAAAFAFVPTMDVNRILTPQLSGREDTYLMHFRLSDHLYPPLGGGCRNAEGVRRAGLLPSTLYSPLEGECQARSARRGGSLPQTTVEMSTDDSVPTRPLSAEEEGTDSAAEPPTPPAAFGSTPPQGGGKENGGNAASLGGSIAAQLNIFSPTPEQVPDIAPAALSAALQALAQCKREDLLLAYHDCSDGGLWATLCEMAFAANCGLNIFADKVVDDAASETDGGGSGIKSDDSESKKYREAKIAAALFNEAPAAVLEVPQRHAARVMEIFTEAGVALQTVARPNVKSKTVCVYDDNSEAPLLKKSLRDLRHIWEEVSVDIASKRDNPDCVAQEAERDMDGDPGLFVEMPPTLYSPLEGECQARSARRGGSLPQATVEMPTDGSVPTRPVSAEREGTDSAAEPPTPHATAEGGRTPPQGGSKEFAPTPPAAFGSTPPQGWGKESAPPQGGSIKTHTRPPEGGCRAAGEAGGGGARSAPLRSAEQGEIRPARHNTSRPKVAILREVGTNGQREMAAAFTSAGFDAIDITMQDLLDGTRKLDESFHGAALCGGFSYGDVLGAGRGWALSVLNHPLLKEMFTAFFARPDTFTLGVCNGCQALAHMQALMPNADEWCFPEFLPNESQRFEARLSMVEVLRSPSPFLSNLAGLKFPIVVSHGEGKADFSAAEGRKPADTVMRFVDNHGEVTTSYPANPNGSPAGATGFCSPDGRITLMMPHPERIYRRLQMGWQPPELKGMAYTPWQLLFANARQWLHDLGGGSGV